MAGNKVTWLHELQGLHKRWQRGRRKVAGLWKNIEHRILNFDSDRSPLTSAATIRKRAAGNRGRG
jgi:hypothetical protein